MPQHRIIPQAGVIAGLMAVVASTGARAEDPPALPADPLAVTRADTAEWLEVNGNRFRFYGFPRMDVAYSDSAVAPNNQYAMWAVSEDDTLGGDNDEVLDFYPRLTRFGLLIERDSIPRLETASLTGKIELDFQNGGSESRARPRLRHGFVRIDDSRGWSLLAGQTWDLISPLYPAVNGDGMMWNTGNTGDRRPQVRFTWNGDLGEESGYSLAVAAARQGAINNRDLDGDGTADGIDSGKPMLQARAGVSDLLGGRLDAGVWGHYAWEDADLGVGPTGEDEFKSRSVGVDASFAVTDALTLQGELFAGRNLDDIRAGVGQGVNAVTGREIDSRGGWLEARYRCADWTTFAAGYLVDNPSDNDLDATIAGGARERNEAWYLAQHFDLGGGLGVGVELIHWNTEYAAGLDDGDANRLNLWIRYSF